MKDITVYIFAGVLLVLVGFGFYQDLTGSSIEVENSKSCFVESLGTTNDSGNIRNVYSYCLESVDLSKVKLDDGTVSYSKLIHNLDEEDCLWDGGTCTYYGDNYKIISCGKMLGSDDVVITSLDNNFDYVYEEFCSFGDE